MTQYGIAVDTHLCMGCNTCAVACKVENNIPDSIWWNRVLTDGGGGSDTARGAYGDSYMRYMTVACQHCENPACVKVCPVGATYKDPVSYTHLDVYKRQDVNLVILDLGLSDRDGTEVIGAVRGWSRVPIIVLSARQEDADKVTALDAGADDYLTKPFSVAELLARVRVALRRVAFDETEEEAGETYRNGDLAIDFDAKVVVRGDDEIHLTPIEYKLLVLLAHNTGKVLTHNYILKEVWGCLLYTSCTRR